MLRYWRHRLWGLGTIGLLVAWLAAPSASVGEPPSPPGLQQTQVNITDDLTHRYGEPDLAVNPTNPNNLVYHVMSNMQTYDCEEAGDPLCMPTPPLGTPLGQYVVPGWISTKLFVTFDRGQTWSNVDFPSIPAFRGFPGEGEDHSDLLSRGDPMVTVTADGTFYIGWDAMNLGIIYLPPGFEFGGIVICPETTPPPGCPVGGLIDGGIAVSKSTDGGLTWSTPVLTATGVDRPWMVTDLSTGTVYEASSGFVNGSMSTGNPALPSFASASDRWVVSSPDGATWTAPQRFGEGAFSGAGGSKISAANGVLAATFHATADDACQHFVSTPGPCTVFETSTDSGATWSRHAVPGLSSATGSILVAAHPAIVGSYTVAALDASGTQFLVYVTDDSGTTWSGPTAVTDDPGTTKFKPWINYSPDGVLGLMWRSNEPGPSPAPYSIWAAISRDEGTTFSEPLEVSTASSPPPGGPSDDTSVIALSGSRAFIGWGDSRPGDLSGFFSAVKLGAFEALSARDRGRRGRR